MKKIIFLLFILCFSVLKVDASEWSEWTDVLPEGENIEIETEVRYKWYKERKISEGYVDKVENVCEYLDETDTITKKYTSVEFPGEKDGRVIKSFESSGIKDMNYVSTISFLDLQIGEDLPITEVEVYNESLEKTVPYDIAIHTLFVGQNAEDIKDDNFTDLAVNFKYHDRFTLALDQFYKLENLTLKIHFIKINSNFDKITLEIGHNTWDATGQGRMYDITENTKCTNDNCVLSISLKNYLKPTNYNTISYGYEYTDTLYKCYNIETEYLDGYYPHIENYEKDEKTEKTFYRYKVLENESSTQTTLEPTPIYEERKTTIITYKKLDEEESNLNKQNDNETDNGKQNNNETDYDNENKLSSEEAETKENETKEDNTVALLTDDDNTNSTKKVLNIILITFLSLIIVTTICYFLKKYFENCRMK